MQLRTGSILIAHPAHAVDEHQQKLILIIQNNDRKAIGLVLNDPSTIDMVQLMQQHHVDWLGDSQVFVGGEYNVSSLVVLHSDEWYSSHTIQVDSGIAVSSDITMIQKMAMGNSPDWYRLFVGYAAWNPAELAQELSSSKPKWLVLTHPSQCLVESHPDDQWSLAVEEYSQELFSNYI